MAAGQFIRYALVGCIGTAAHLLTLAACVEWMGTSIVTGSVLGFCVALALSYALNRYWTFRTGRAGVGSLWRYAMVCVAGLAVNVGLMVALVQWLQWRYLVAQLSVIFVVPIANYLLSRHWAFDAARRRRP